MKFIGRDGKEIEVKAKIDTGADSTSIDTALARELGFGDVLDFFETIPKPTSTDREDLKKLSDEYDKKYKDAYPGLFGVVFTYSSNGFTMRPKITVSFVMDTLEVSARVSVVDRAQLEYPAIIGRKSLSRFLIDVNKQ